MIKKATEYNKITMFSVAFLINLGLKLSYYLFFTTQIPSFPIFSG